MTEFLNCLDVPLLFIQEQSHLVMGLGKARVVLKRLFQQWFSLVEPSELNQQGCKVKRRPSRGECLLAVQTDTFLIKADGILQLPQRLEA